MFCNNCGQDSQFSFSGVIFPDTRQCDRCEGFVYTVSQNISLADHYQENYFNGAEYLGYLDSRVINRKNFSRKIALLEKVLHRPIQDFRILEVGCASGDFLELCKERGAKKLLGIEISNYCREICEKKDIPVISPDDPSMEDRISGLKPDLIVAWDVWEHLENPALIFGEMIKLADEAVSMALTTIQVDSLTAKTRKEKWRQFHPPTHLCYPTRSSFSLFFKTRGFKILKHSFFGYYRSLAEYAAAVFPRIKSNRNLLKPLFRLSLYLNLYDIQLIIATRKN